MSNNRCTKIEIDLKLLSVHLEKAWVNERIGEAKGKERKEMKHRFKFSFLTQKAQELSTSFLVEKFL